MPRREQHLTQVVRQAPRQPVGPRWQVPDQELGQVGIPGRTREDLVQHGPGHGAGPQQLHLLRGLLLGEPGQRHVVDRGQPDQVGQPAVEGVAVLELLVTVGAEHQQTLAVEAGDEVGDEVQRADVGPLEVVDHQHGRALVRDAGDRALELVQDAPGGASVHVRGRLRRGHVALPTGQRVTDRGVRRRGGAEVDAAAPQDDVPGRLRLGADRPDQGGLPDSGLPVDEGRRRNPGHRRPEQFRQPMLLGPSTGDALLRRTRGHHPPTVGEHGPCVTSHSGPGAASRGGQGAYAASDF